MSDFIIFGEILFDCFGDATTLGGAPLNVGAHLSKLGLTGRIVSAVGNDSLGHQALGKIKSFGLDTGAIAVLKDRETGRADVVMRGENADYTFNDAAAWDFIPYPDNIEDKTEILYFGTLSQRSTKSRETLEALFRNVKARHIFYDVNIRKTFYSREIIKLGLERCTILKMNNEELPLIEHITECADIESIIERFSIDTVLLTEGKRGTTAVCKDGGRYHAGTADVAVADTVGAGDALSAGFLAALASGRTTEQAVRTGARLADFVVSRRGAIPDYDDALVTALKKEGLAVTPHFAP